MHYYEHHLGDHARGAGHLSMLQEGAYRRLLDAYYTREQPLPAEVRDVCRLVRARSKPEREAVEAVLREFFEATQDGWRHSRCEREIARFQDKQRKAKASADARWSRQPQSERNAKALPDEMRTHSEGNAPRARSQAPGTSPQPPETKHHSSDASHLQDDDKNPSGSSAAPTPTPAKKVKTDSAQAVIPCPYDEIIAIYHELLSELPRVHLRSASREKAMRKMWGWVLTSSMPTGQKRAENRDQALDWFGRYFRRAGHNDFLMGRTGRSAGHENWRCDFDFLLTERGMRHVIEKTEEAA